MERYVLDDEDFDLELTMTCGQTFCWHRVAGTLYEDGEPHFYTFRKNKPIIIEDTDEGLVARTELPREEVEEAVGLDRDLQEIFSTFPDDRKLEKAREELWGLRIIQDEFFPCLISYLCSPQMRIPRIKEMHNKMAEKFGETRMIDGIEMRRFPTLEELAEASEDDLRDLGIGYRAKYIVETVKILQETDFDPEEVRGMEYEEAREEMKNLYGVGDKVADCVLLFSLGFYEAYPIDTWASQLIEEQYPELFSDDYEEISKNVREYFGEDAGYAQEYLFHAARKGILET
ncbi:DNA-3-methyladenine glycosylase family protein [Candidatus Nanosalina sp. VS9-1]|uniref:DNA-3-methyladenine glycosylase family protein n=1 Tax=Candidatus Nanosalina sp. VS9-1 TaxID=3388566 RepID=UPI0039DFFF10